MKLLKGDPALNALTLIVAATAGTFTGKAVEGLSPLGAFGVAVLVGIVVGGALYALIFALKRRRSS